MAIQSETAPADDRRGSDSVLLGGEHSQNSQSLNAIQGLGDNRLVVLASEIKTEHANATIAAKKSLRHAIAAGERLIEAKELVPHGQWLPWLTSNIGFSERTAQVYMRVAERRGDIESAAAADFTLRAALEAVADREQQVRADDVRLVPLYGHARVGIAVDKSIWIAPSERHPGFLYATLVINARNEADAIGTLRPARMSALDLVVSMLAPETVFEWHDVEVEPWMFNPCLGAEVRK